VAWGDQGVALDGRIAAAIHDMVPALSPRLCSSAARAPRPLSSCSCPNPCV
jgi:hypothetical protein